MFNESMKITKRNCMCFLSLSLSLFLPSIPLIFFSLHREAFSDAPLMTQTMRMAQIEKKYESYEKAVVRVHFPDRWVLQGCFRPRESCELQIVHDVSILLHHNNTAVKSLVRFIRDNLADPQIKFHLCE